MHRFRLDAVSAAIADVARAVRENTPVPPR
jgi:hypothetical protein